jgi:hypothetical protein
MTIMKLSQEDENVPHSKTDLFSMRIECSEHFIL